MDLVTFHTCLAQPTARGYNLNQQQKEVVNYGEDSLMDSCWSRIRKKRGISYLYPKAHMC